MATWSVSQQKFIDMPETVAGGVGSEVPAGMATGITSPTQPAQAGGGLVGGNEQLYNALMMLGLGQIGTTTGGRIISGAQYVRPPQETESEKKRKLEKTRAELMSRQMDSVLDKWEKVPLLERLPIPFVSRVSPSRATYETSRDAFNYFVITLAADKRITDQEREYWLRQFPPLLSTKGVAKAKINELKNFIRAFAGMEAPAIMETPQGTQSISDFAQQYWE